MSVGTLDKQPISSLKGVGDKLRQQLERLKLYTVFDLLLHLPIRYDTYESSTPISELSEGMVTGIHGTILQIETQGVQRKRLHCVMQTDSGRIALCFLKGIASIKSYLKPGLVVRAYGMVRRYQASVEMIHPKLTFCKPDDDLTRPLISPVYRSTKDLKQHVIRKLMRAAVAQISATNLPELLPSFPGAQAPKLTLAAALAILHDPKNFCDSPDVFELLQIATQRLAVEELLSYSVTRELSKKSLLHKRGYAFPNQPSALERACKANLSFQLTSDQLRVLREIQMDLASEKPMLRLLQGDVGSGKTVVAALAALRVIAEKKQVAFMVPTELLAMQHAQTLTEWFAPLNLMLAVVRGSMSETDRQQAYESIASGATQLIIGTQALFQKKLTFNEVGLVIIDEQHRFGVEQRLDLWLKNGRSDRFPHQLIMTATPIPRTLAMTLYHDLTLSVIKSLPPGRVPIKTVALGQGQRDRVIQRLYKACLEEKRQAYWVCTLIEASDSIEAETVAETTHTLRMAMPQLSIGSVHSKMTPEEKCEVMDAFHCGLVDVLVATIVIEVGVNVPNASLMVIDNPERLGLAQLHQLRGRIGRGTIPSSCVLLHGNDLSDNAKARIAALKSTQDGFLLAEHDLRIRGAGELLGTRQTGASQFRFVAPETLGSLFEEVRLLQKLLNEPTKLGLIERWFQGSTAYLSA